MLLPIHIYFLSLSGLTHVLQLNKKIARSHFCVKVKLPPQTITQEIPHDKYNTRYEISSIPFKLR